MYTHIRGWTVRIMPLPLLALFSVSMVAAYKPVVLVHGVFGTADGEFRQTFDKWIPEEHKGTTVYPIRLYEKFCSLTPMWIQIAKIRQKVAAIMSNHSEGIHFICFSQGGLLCRGVLSSMNHNVDAFISLSSPQAGQYGIPERWKKYIDILKKAAYKLLYSNFFQERLSIANYWNDPHHQDLFRKHSAFLAPLDGTTPTANLTEYKINFLKLRKLVLIGGPQDDVIRPWESSQFGFYDDKEGVVEMKNQQFFMNDDFGLKTLYSKGKVSTFTFSGVRHSQWYTNRTVFNEAILPFLT